MAGSEEDRTETGNDTGEQLGVPPSAQLTGEQTSEDDVDASKEGRHHRQGGNGVTEDELLQPVDHGNQGRIVDIPPRKVVATLEVVELVPMGAVAIRGQELEDDLCAGQGPEESPCNRSKIGDRPVSAVPIGFHVANN
jgi:hypothetical protein